MTLLRNALPGSGQAGTRAAAEVAMNVFAEKYRVKYEKAVTCLTKDREALLAFYDFPAEHSHDRSQAFLQGDLAGGTGNKIVWMCKAGDGTETTVEQTLIRGLVTA